MSPSQMEWLYGPRKELGAVGYVIRPLKLNATSIDAIQRAMALLSNDQDGPVIVRNATGEITGELTHLHRAELTTLSISNNRYSLQIQPGRRPLLSGTDPNVREDGLLEAIESVSQYRMRIRPLAAATPWVLPAFAAVAFFMALRAGVDAAGAATSSAVVALAVVLAWTVSAQIWAGAEGKYPDSTVSPIRWADVLANRAKVIYTVIGFASGAVIAVIGALATIVFTV